MKKINWHKIIILTIFTFMSLGFTVLFDARWEINESDPHLWIDLCKKDHQFDSLELDPADDLYDQGTVTSEQLLNSVINDFNKIASSYLNLEVVPDDPSNPPAGSNYDATKAINRTITICEGDLFLAIAQAQPDIEDNKLKGCKIKYSDRTLDSAKEWVLAVSHELGHCLGLDHPHETRHSIMSYFVSSDFYRLQIDDKMGITYLFPKTIDGVNHDEKPTYGLSCHFRD